MKKKFPELSNTDQCKTFYVIIRFSLEMLLCASAEALKYMLYRPTPLNIFSVSKCQLPVNITEAIIHGIVHRILAKPTQHTHTKGYIDVLCWIQRLIIIQLTCRFLRKDKFPTAHRTDWCAEIKVLPNIFKCGGYYSKDTELFGYIVSCIDDRPIRSVDLFKAQNSRCA